MSTVSSVKYSLQHSFIMLVACVILQDLNLKLESPGFFWVGEGGGEGGRDKLQNVPSMLVLFELLNHDWMHFISSPVSRLDSDLRC